MSKPEVPVIIALVAGEASGDQLGAALIRAIHTSNPDIQFTGIGGPLMRAQGMQCWWDYTELAVMGLFDVIRHIPRLLKLRRQLIARVLELKPAVYIGIDAPDFNLGVEKRLRIRSIPVIHYVSPTVWAWRPGRVKKIARATERVLCLFPFEPWYYRNEPVLANYTGHPMADRIPLQNDAATAQKSLGIDTDGPCVALLPGSRTGEVEKHVSPMLDAAEILSKQYPGVLFLVPAATAAINDYIKSELLEYPDLNCLVFSGRSTEVMAAADVVACVSGTATLEVMLTNRPMVICYRLSRSTYATMKWFKLLKSRFFGLPNILADQELVPELLQDEVNGIRIAKELTRWLEQPELRHDLMQQFNRIHLELMINAADTAASAVLQHIADVESTPARIR